MALPTTAPDRRELAADIIGRQHRCAGCDLITFLRIFDRPLPLRPRRLAEPGLRHCGVADALEDGPLILEFAFVPTEHRRLRGRQTHT
jgi:hypothetical protein